MCCLGGYYLNFTLAPQTKAKCILGSSCSTMNARRGSVFPNCGEVDAGCDLLPESHRIKLISSAGCDKLPESHGTNRNAVLRSVA